MKGNQNHTKELGYTVSVGLNRRKGKVKAVKDSAHP